jgi:hypothetical protein
MKKAVKENTNQRSVQCSAENYKRKKLMKKIVIEVPNDIELENHNIFLAPKDSIRANCEHCDNGMVATVGVCGDCGSEFTIDEHIIQVHQVK